MCIVFVALEQHPGYKFVILSNRDEALSRPTLRSHFWDPASAPAPIDRINLPAGLSSDAKDLSGQVSTADEATINEILGGMEFASSACLDTYLYHSPQFPENFPLTFTILPICIGTLYCRSRCCPWRHLARHFQNWSFFCRHQLPRAP